MNAHAPDLIERARRYEAAGRHDLALAVYVETRRFADAGRLAWHVGAFAEAVGYYTEAGMPYEVALCLYKLGRLDHCVQALVRVQREHPVYRRACQLAVRVTCELGRLDMTVDHFLARYLATSPQEERDLDAFDRISRLYEAMGMAENAAEVLRRLVAAHPRHRDAAQRLQKLALRSQNVPAVDLAFASEAVAFQRTPIRKAPAAVSEAMPVLPKLPSLPPRAGGATPPPTRGSSGAVATVVTAPAVVEAPRSASGEFNALELPDGMLVAERYKLERRIGMGGMAAVYSALDIELDERVAIKTFQSDDVKLIARFKQEVALSRKLSHPNVIRLHDFGSQGRMKFLTMELLEGVSLEQCVGRPMDIARGVRVLLQACSGLGAAHAAGIVHRDIKPANFFVTKQGTVKLMDFGIAKRPTGDPGLTTAGFIAGTPQYMAPEQISNFATAGAPADLYALGIMAFELFSGAVPFDHEDLVGLLMLHVKEPAPSLRARAPRVPPSLDALVASLLAKDPSQRPASCEALAETLREIARELPRTE